MKAENRTQIIRLLVLIFVVALTILLLIFRDQIRHLQGYGYPGIFLLSILANATIIIPLPGVILTTAMGAVFHPFWVAVAAGAGSALGELSGYLAGFSGRAVLERADWHVRLVEWMHKYGEATIFVLALVPNPAFDMAGISAGALRMPVQRFLFWCFLGKLMKMLLFAYGGLAIFNGLFFGE